MSITKTAGIEVLALQSIASGGIVVGSEVDVSAKIAANLFIHFGRRATSALSAPVVLRIEASSKDSGPGHWYPLMQVETLIAAAEAENLSNSESPGDSLIEVASTTNLAAKDIVFFDNATIANGEFHRIKSVVLNTSFTIEDTLVNAQASGTTVYDMAEMFALALDLSGVKRLRVVVDASGAGQATAAEAHLVTLDSLA